MLHHTDRGAKQHTIILISRCSGPVLSILSAPLRRRGQGALGTFCSAFGKTSGCLRFIVLAKIAGFSRIDIFDNFGRPGSVDVSPHCRSLYKVARRRVRHCFRRPVSRLTRGSRYACRRVGRHLGTRCSNCRFDRGVLSVCGPFDVLGTFSSLRVHSC